MSRNPDLDENPGETHMSAGISNQGGMAPQATSTISVPAPPPATITATGNVGAVTCLNPFGPRNEMAQGGVVFDIVGLVYSQFIQIPTQLEVTDSSVPWTVIAQLPYNPLSEYCNKFIRTYAGLHQRYNGDMLYQIEVIGNATFSGTIMAVWYPTKYPKSIADPEDVMKYVYKTMSVTMPSVEEMILKDARQVEYYRTHSANVDDRPHILLIVHTSVVSPLKDGITVRIRIGSRLCSLTDQAMGKGSAMMFADPVPNAIGPSPSSNFWNGRRIIDIFPHLINADYRLTLDGTKTFNFLPKFMNRPEMSLQVPTSGHVAFFNSTADYGKDGTFFAFSDNGDNSWLLIMQHNFGDTSALAYLFKVDFPSDLTPDQVINKVKTQNLTYLDGVSRINAAEFEWGSGKIIMQVAGASFNGNYVLYLWKPNTGVKVTNFVTPLNDVTKIATFPFAAALGPILSDDGTTGLPTTWRNVCISSLPVTSVIASDAAPTFHMDGTIHQVFENESAKLPDNTVLQFDLQDPESKQRVATLRYIKSRRALVIQVNSTTRYALYPSTFSNVVVANFGPVSDTSAFPNTDVSNWPSRVASTYMYPNAAAAAMAIPETLVEMDAAVTDMGALFSGESSLMSQAKAFPWSTGRSIYQTRVSSAQTAPRFDNAVYTQTGQDTSDASTQVSIPSQKDMKLGEITSRAMSLGEIQSLVGPNNRYAFANGSAVSSGINWAHDADMLGRAQSYQGNQSEQDRKQALAMQQMSFGQENSMQQMKNAQAMQYQSNEFGQQSAMQHAAFNQESQMQQNSFDQQMRMQNSSQQYGKDMAGIGYQNASALNYQSILGGLANTATGGAFGMVTEGMHDISSYVNQKSSQNFQEKMNPILFGQQKSLQLGSIMGNIANTATGGAFGLLGDVIKGGEDIYLNSSNQSFQQSMLTQQQNFAQQQQARNFNNAIYANGMSAQALKVA